MLKFNTVTGKRWVALPSVMFALLIAVMPSKAQITKEELPDMDPAVYKNYMNSKLSGTVKGYAFYLMKDGKYVTSDEGGIARTAQDNNGVPLAYNENTLQEIASVSKVITAVAMLRVLEKSAAVSMDSPIGPYLPKGWKPGADFAKITFRQLLRHKAGLRPDTNIKGEGYENVIEQYSRLPIHPDSVKIRAYWNVNYQIMRIVIPNIINANHRNNDLIWADQLSKNQITMIQYNALIAQSGSAIYRNYVMEYLFKPAGITAPTCNPLNVQNLAWAYATRASLKGSPGADHSLYCSSGFWQVSAKDLATFISKVMMTEEILANSTKKILNNTESEDVTGWSHKLKRGNGLNYGHGGDIKWGASEVHSYLLYMPGNYVAYVQVNSGELGSQSLRGIQYEAFDAARKFPYNCYASGATLQFPNSSYGGHISKVSFGKISQISGKSTGYSYFNSYTTSFKQDSSYTLALTSAYNSVPANIYWSVWIDYNQDKVFQSSERVLNKQSISGQMTKAVVKIPASALLGNTRMRVSLKRHDSQGIADACESFQYGEVEDYNITITKPCGLITNLKAVNINSNGAQLTFSKSADNTVSYVIRYTEVGSGVTKVDAIPASAHATVVHQILNLKPSTQYAWSVRAGCGDYGPLQYFTTQPLSICGTDVYEGNHNSINATPVKIGQTLTALICSNTLTPDQDWYTFEVISNTLAGTKVKADLTSLPADYDLYLYSSDNQLLSSSLKRGTSSETIERVLSPGRYYVRVSGYAGAENTHDYYQLTVTKSDAITSGSAMRTAGETESAEEFKVYPNPVSGGTLTIDFEHVLPEEVQPQVQLSKTTGTAVTPDYVYAPGEGKLRINTEGLEKGIYTLKLMLDNKVISRIIAVQ